MNVATLGSEAELRLGVYFCFRLFNVVPETTARFSHLNIQRRDHSPPWLTHSDFHCSSKPTASTFLTVIAPVLEGRAGGVIFVFPRIAGSPSL